MTFASVPSVIVDSSGNASGRFDRETAITLSPPSCSESMPTDESTSRSNACGFVDVTTNA